MTLSSATIMKAAITIRKDTSKILPTETIRIKPIIAGTRSIGRKTSHHEILIIPHSFRITKNIVRTTVLQAKGEPADIVMLSLIL
jgi:hypothetical protein